MKPTIVYLIFAGVLAFGMLRKRNYLKSLLGSAFQGLDEQGWDKLAQRWCWFFLVLAALNEMFWRLFSTDIWLHFKIWGDTLLTFLFAMAQMPMLLRHGLSLKDEPEADKTGNGKGKSG
jgi:intracellular septation protein